MNEKCPVCLKKAALDEHYQGRDANQVSCPRCGNFIIARTLATVGTDKFGPKHIISGLLRNRHEKGEITDLHSNNLKEMLESTKIPTNPFDIIDSLLKGVETK